MATPRGAKLIVGLDYGTTKTLILINGLLGIAYAYWDPSHPQASAIKCVPFGKKQFVPSHVGYGGNGEVLWGDAASGSAVPGYTWTKVLLNDDGPQEHSFGSGLLSRLVRNGFFYMSKDKPDTVVVDFLKQVRKHVAAHLELDYMEEVPPTEFWFTIPATWTEKARDRFLRAINLAGFGTRPQDHVLFLLEAEAAALATGKSRAIVVCDCGGATSDITAFRISNNGSDQEFGLMSASTGVYCGGAEVDARLLKHLEVTDPVAVAAATEQQADLVATVEMAVRLKIDFTGTSRAV
ncbi:hypothetical protein ASPCAL13290 [Aspergillus calidoustus]|uniref:Uncharacterized protein n=1 Tax=Aspergillus calidoustus TaxID=454130 RepID=A0A0U4ZKQ0_ASPCI|nr:hypothetical protein ASPCAL13290 [Aspergillus calidoustus]